MAKGVQLWGVVGMLALLVACGGGGGGDEAGAVGTPPPAGGSNDGSNGGTPPAPPPPAPPPAAGGDWLRFEPALVAATLREGTGRTVALDVTADRVVEQAVHVVITDAQGVLTQPQVQARSGPPDRFQATFTIPRGLAPGRHAGELLLQLCRDVPVDGRCTRQIEGSPWRIPYAVDVEPWRTARVQRRLVLSDAAVALSSLPAWSSLSRDVSVSDSLGRTTGWEATSDQPWLRVTPSGSTAAGASTLRLAADPQGLPMDWISHATVTLRSTDPAVPGTEQIAVALWRGSATPSVARFTEPVRQVVGYQRLAADRLRPWVYAHNGRGVVDIYNVYTAQRVGSIAFGSAVLGHMAVADDGSALYVLDLDAQAVAAVDLRAPGFSRRHWPRAAGAAFDADTRILATRTNGEPLLVLNTGQVLRARDGMLLSAAAGGPSPYHDPTFFAPWTTQRNRSVLAALPDGSRVLAPDGLVGVSWDMDYDAAGEGRLSLQPPQFRLDLPSGVAAQDAAVSPDGRWLYAVHLAFGCSVWRLDADAAPTAPACPGTGRVSGVQLARDGRAVFLSHDYGRARLDILDPGGQPVRTLPIEEADVIAGHPLVLSPDGWMAVTVRYGRVDGQVHATSLRLEPVGP